MTTFSNSKTSETMLQFGSTIDVREAIGVSSAVRSLPKGTQVVLDFRKVRSLPTAAHAALIPALFSLRDRVVRALGLDRIDPELANLYASRSLAA